jgi:hypothetical protein
MSKDISDIFHTVKRQALQDDERVSMRNTIRAFMAEHPARAPLAIRMMDGVAALADAFGAQASRRFRFVPATLALFLVLGVGTTYAAEGALPGDVLYAVKIGVNERLQEALAFSAAAKTSWYGERIERRLAEAEILVAEGKLTPVAQTHIEAHLQTTVDAFDTQVEKLAAIEGDTAAAAAHSDLEASLIGHAEVLVALSARSASEGAAQSIIRSIISKAERAQSIRAAKEAGIASRQDRQKVRAAALEKQEMARKAIDNVREKAATGFIAATSSAQIAHEAADVAERALTDAEAKLRDGDYGRAFSTFQEAIRNVRTVEVHIDASERLKADVKVFTRGSGSGTSDVSATLMIATEPAQSE